MKGGAPSGRAAHSGMSTLLLILSIVYAVAVCALLYLSRRNRRYYAPAKGVASALFVLVGVAAYFSGAQRTPGNFWLLLAALVLCAVGDVLLGLANRSKKVQAKPFLAGFFCFAAAHVLFCALFYRFAPLTWMDALPPMALLLMLWWLDTRKKVRLKKMRVPAYIYTTLVGLMAGKAVQAAFAPGSFGDGAFLLALGSLLFLTSDVILLFLYFAPRRLRWLRYANLTTYYIGVYLLGLSAHWL